MSQSGSAWKLVMCGEARKLFVPLSRVASSFELPPNVAFCLPTCCCVL